MKRSFILAAALIMLMLGAMQCCVCAAPSPSPSSASSVSSIAVNPVNDYAGFLTREQSREIEDMLGRLRDTYAADTAVVTVKSLGALSAEQYADDYYDNNGFGIGSDSSGILLLISEEPRRYHITTCGKCFDIFSGRAIDYMCERVEARLRNDDYYGACTEFAGICAEVLGGYAEGREFKPPKSIGVLFALLAAALILAVIITAAARSTMNNAKRQTHADRYAEGGGIKLSDSRDIFLYSSVTRTPIPKQTGGSGGHGHVSSGGRVHGGGGGSY